MEIDYKKLVEELQKQLDEKDEIISSLTKEKDEILKNFYVINKKLNEAVKRIQIYEEKYHIEQTRRFISKSEKINDIVINEPEEIIKEKRKRTTNIGKKYKTLKNILKGKETETIYLNPQEKVCPFCNKELIVASKSEPKYGIEVIPAKIKITKYIKICKKCPACNKQNNKIYYPISSSNIDGSFLTPSLAAYEVYCKYGLGIPFNSFAKHLNNELNVDISKEDIANHMAKVSKILEPVFDKMKEDLLNSESHVLHSDETTLVVSKKDKDNENRKKSYVYVLTSSFYEPNQIRIYDFHESRGIDSISNWISSFNGTVVCDDFKGYDKLVKNNKNITLQRCWAHVRRKYTDILKNVPKNKQRKTLSYEILENIEKIFKLEREYKEKQYTSSKIKECRKESIPIIKERLYKLIFKSNPLPNSALYQAIEYTKNCWKDLFTFVDNGLVEVTNNTAERAVKPFVIQRKVFQTSGSYAGARYTTKLFSIVQTCKINNINIQKYFEYVLKNINKEKIEDLLPYSNNIKTNLHN